jgi:hypothetical protein
MKNPTGKRSGFSVFGDGGIGGRTEFLGHLKCSR